MLDGHRAFSITIEPTPTVLIMPPDITGVRIWRGETSEGLPVTVLVATLCSDSANQPDFEYTLDAEIDHIT